MAHRAVWLAGKWTQKDAVKKGEALIFSAANETKKAGAVGDVPIAVAARDMKAGEQTDAHLANPPSEIIECKADAAIPAGSEVRVTADGKFENIGTNAGYVIGFVAAAVADNDIFELHVRPRYKPSTA